MLSAFGAGVNFGSFGVIMGFYCAFEFVCAEKPRVLAAFWASARVVVSGLRPLNVGGCEPRAPFAVAHSP